MANDEVSKLDLLEKLQSLQNAEKLESRVFELEREQAFIKDKLANLSNIVTETVKNSIKTDSTTLTKSIERVLSEKTQQK